MHLSEAPQRVMVETTAYRLEFHRPADRWEHSLTLAANSSPLTLHSLESGPESTAPRSPVFQDLRTERRDSQRCEIQLFGQAGQQVYSAAVNCHEGAITFDLCVRDRTTATVPAISTYRAIPSGSFDAEGRVEWPGWRLETAPLREIPRATVRIGDSALIEILSAEVPRAKGGRTLRWAYSLLQISQELQQRLDDLH